MGGGLEGLVPVNTAPLTTATVDAALGKAARGAGLHWPEEESAFALVWFSSNENVGGEAAVVDEAAHLGQREGPSGALRIV
jgi:hypothetical protein